MLVLLRSDSRESRSTFRHDPERHPRLRITQGNHRPVLHADVASLTACYDINGPREPSRSPTHTTPPTHADEPPVRPYTVYACSCVSCSTINIRHAHPATVRRRTLSIAFALPKSQQAIGLPLAYGAVRRHRQVQRPMRRLYPTGNAQEACVRASGWFSPE